TRRENRLRFVHASATLGPVDVYLDDQRVAENVAPRGSTEWRTVATRGYTVNVRTAGDAPDAPPVLSQPVAPQPDQAGTLVLYDTRARTGSSESMTPRVAFIVEDMRPTAADQARMVAFNGVDADLMQVASEDQNVSGLGAIGQGQASPAVSLPARQYRLNLNAFQNAQGLAQGSATTAEVATVTLEPGYTYLYVATGNLEDRSPLLLSTEVGQEAAQAATATPGNAFMVRLIHTLRGAPEVDVYIGDDLALQGVRYGEGTAYRPTSPTVRPIRVVRAGTDEVIVQADLNPPSSQRVMLLLIGLAEQPDLLQTAEQPISLSANAQVRAIHAAPDAPPFTVDIPLATSNSFTRPGVGPTATPRLRQYVDPIGFPALSAPFALRPGTYTFTIRSAVDGLVMLQTDVTLESGKRYDLALITGQSGPELRVIVSEDTP
ncbi:MAG: DUF4397 domain-containing protein, partial [Anaerolineae bacterium]|nr:DUF4397 domain-containing protein [Anaerolineae bacterium]